MATDNRRFLAEHYKRVLIVSGDSRVGQLVDTLLGKTVPSAETEIIDPGDKNQMSLEGVDLVVVGVSRRWRGVDTWLTTHLAGQKLPAISIDFAATVSAAVKMMRLGCTDYIDSKELDKRRLVRSLLAAGGTNAPADAEGALDEASSEENTPISNVSDLNKPLRSKGGANKAVVASIRSKASSNINDQTWPFTIAQMEDGTATAGDYRILDFLGVGAMASVFKAQRISDDALFAIKLLNPTVADGSARERFEREFTMLNSIKHPHVIKMEEQFNDGKWMHSVMEYLPGGDLKARIRRRLQRDQAVRYASQIAAALQAAHKRGVIHRDLKPANVLFRTDGTLVLADFGVAKSIKGVGDTLTQEGQMVGTPYYVTPEQATGGQVDSRSDLYSLGIILYEMLEGRRPFVGDTLLKVLTAHVKDPVPLLSQEWDMLNDVLAQLLAKDPADRLPDGASVVRALEQACPGDVPKGLLDEE